MTVKKMYRLNINGIYFILAVLTVILLLWNRIGMETVIQLFPNEQIKIVKMDDSINEGISKSDISVHSDHVVLSCQTINSNKTHAFCGFAINLPRPMNLNSYKSLKITISKESDVNDTTLIYLINNEPESNSFLKERLNLRPIFVTEQTATYELPIDTFNIPSWWLLANYTDKHNGAPRYNRINKIGIVTGDSTVERQEKITVYQIKITGKTISPLFLQSVLLTFWIALIILHIVILIRRQVRAIAVSKKRAASLERLNNVLNIEKNKFETLAKTDPLTGVYNRAGLRPYFSICLKSYTTSNRPSSLIIFDVDKFKKLNDKYGHSKGDQVLKSLCHFVKTHTRQEDAFARWGGEEFVIVCQNTSIEDATAMAGELCKEIEKSTFSGIKITCSFGVSSINSSGLENWIVRADEALYKAKNNGRNQVQAD